MIAYVLLRVFVILLLVAINAFFAAAEFALVSVRETRIQQLIEAHRAGARTVLKLHQQLGRVVNGVQLGITVTSLTLGWLGEPVLARLFEVWIGSVPYATLYAHAVAVPVAFALITSLHVILGELVPKSLPLQRAERVALAVAAPMDVFLTVTAPLTIGMSRAAGFVLRAFGTREVRHGSVHSPDELKLIVTAAHLSRPGRYAAERARTGQHHRAPSDGAADQNFFLALRPHHGRSPVARSRRTTLARPGV